jgi:hypothetical protein
LNFGTGVAPSEAHLGSCGIGGALLRAEWRVLTFARCVTPRLIRSLCEHTHHNLIRDTTPT